ncbi:hypothetical protein BGX28_004058 [Mortierella sp. GBA30]|nr:hypothetical protein BGX28_004058 [Mortierella sp. GBA30]
MYLTPRPFLNESMSSTRIRRETAVMEITTKPSGFSATEPHDNHHGLTDSAPLTNEQDCGANTVSGPQPRVSGPRRNGKTLFDKFPDDIVASKKAQSAQKPQKRKSSNKRQSFRDTVNATKRQQDSTQVDSLPQPLSRQSREKRISYISGSSNTVRTSYGQNGTSMNTHSTMRQSNTCRSRANYSDFLEYKGLRRSRNHGLNISAYTASRSTNSQRRSLPLRASMKGIRPDQTDVLVHNHNHNHTTYFTAKHALSTSPKASEAHPVY